MPVMSCDCVNPQQDAYHGSGRRVFNKRGNKGGQKEARCTSCGKSKPIGGAAPVVKKGK